MAVTGWARATRVGPTLWATPTPPPAFVFQREGWTALHYAACYGHLPAVRALIHAGAPLHIETNSEGFLGGLAFWAVWCG